jgi:hypothetical protein
MIPTKLDGWTKLFEARHVAAGKVWYAIAHGYIPCVYQATLWHCVKDLLDAKTYRNVQSAADAAPF